MQLVLGRCTGGILLRHSSRLSPTPRHCNRLHFVCRSGAGKGFGSSSSKADSNDDDAGGRRKVKARRVNVKRSESPIPNQGQLNRGVISSPAIAAVEKLEEQMQKREADDEFAKRLAVIKMEGEIRSKEIASTSSESSFPVTAAFDAKTDIYANPPSISETLLSQLNADVSDPKLKNAQIGPNQVGVAIGAVLLGLMFVLVSGADFATSKRYKGVRPSSNPPDGIEYSIIKGRIAQLENAREADPNDPGPLEELAVSYAQLQDYEKAANLLDKLVIARPKDVEAWRLLGETTLLSQQPARSVAAYEKAVAITSDDLQLLTGFADACIANTQYDKAIQYLTKLKANMAEASSSSAAAAPAAKSSKPAADSEASTIAVPPGELPMQEAPPVSAAVSTSAASDRAVPSVDTGSVDLLLAKVYSSWRGHDNDALAVYDGLIKRSPEDFRGYLAKGLFLKEHGRKADAERMFLQARFYAPESRQGFIKQMAGSNPVLDLPGDD